MTNKASPLNKEIKRDQTFKEWRKEVEISYAQKEYSGIFEAILHARYTLKYMRSEEGKEYLIGVLGETPYLENMRKVDDGLTARKIELKILEGALKL